ncbi:MAG: hypothetical protein EZS28_025744 [Streblomastix strix]|uniref:non-specific serine/threonine protein kinase n=1 Tax=Streblomastix strix TaxID=222440 RepID=A0A5J4V8A9_9EUKA|nr:MAG: hypothetical protein EZS28_025744 [Streblomastix strix]
MTFQSDIWPLGVILVELLTGKHPYEGKTQDETISNIRNGKMAPLPADIKGEIREMIINMLNKNPTSRPTASELLETDIMQLQAEIESSEEKIKDVAVQSQNVEVINQVEQPNLILIKIRDNLLIPLQGTQQQIEQIMMIQKKDIQCLNQQLKENGNDELKKRIIQSGIIESLLYIFENQQLDQISRDASSAFFNILSSNASNILLIFDKKPFLGLIRLFQHSDNLIIGYAIASIFSILIGGSNTTSMTSTHPHYESLASCSGIDKIFQLFQRNLDKYTKDKASFCLGFIFRSQVISNSMMRVQIINHLKTLLCDTDTLNVDHAKLALKYIAQNSVNKQEITKDGFTIPQ